MSNIRKPFSILLGNGFFVGASYFVAIYGYRKNMKKSLTLILCVGAICVFTLGSTNILSTQPKNEREYRLKYSDCVFLFPENDTNKARLEINKAIKNLRRQLVAKFIEDFKDFSDSDLDFSLSQNELVITSKTIENTRNIFSIEFDILQYFHGSNGCQRKVETLNFETTPNGANLIKLDDIIRPESKLDLLRLAITKLRNRLGESLTYSLLNGGVLNEFENPQESSKPLSKLIRFTLESDGINVIFPAYTISCGADGILRTKLSSVEIRDILTPRGEKLFQKN